jgi:hypothetical protein
MVGEATVPESAANNLVTATKEARRPELTVASAVKDLQDSVELQSEAQDDAEKLTIDS